jgi:hypothetical protein
MESNRVSVREVADEAGVTVQGVRQWIALGKLAAEVEVVPGGAIKQRFVIRRDVLDEFLADRAANPTPMMKLRAVAS